MSIESYEDRINQRNEDLQEIKDLANPTGPLSIRRDGQMYHEQSYTVNGKKYGEQLNLDYNSGTFLRSHAIIRIDSNGKQTFIDPNSKEGQLVINSSERSSAYSSSISSIEETAKNEGNNDHFQDGITASGMDSIIESGNYGDVSSEYWPGEPGSIGSGEGVVEPQTLDVENQLKVLDVKYPSDMELLQDYMLFEQFAYNAPNKESGLASAATKGLQRNTTIKERKGSVKLPIPNKLDISNGVAWGEGRANAVEAGAFFSARGNIEDLIGGDKNIIDVVKGGVSGGLELLEGVRNDAKAGGQVGQVLSSILAKAALAKMNINVDPGQMIARSTGTTINPNLELLFSGPKLRNFTFGFQFAPNNEPEASDVRKIQRWFRQGMLPTRGASQQIYLGSPNVFRLKYMNGKNRIKGLNIFKICALTAVQVDYTPDQVYQSYEDSKAVSMPVRTNMALSFTELTPIFEDDYSSAKKDVSVTELGLTGGSAITSEDVGF